MRIHWHCNKCDTRGVVEVEGRSRVDKARGLAQVLIEHREQVGLACDGSIGSIDISVKNGKPEKKEEVAGG
jgi:hypothetical protein